MDERNILIIFLEDLRRDPVTELAKCFEFLGVSNDFIPSNQNRKLNPAEEKYFDTRLLRLMRNASLIGGAGLSRMALTRQHSVLKRFGLRRKFRGRIHWDPDALQCLVRELKPEIEKFLEYTGRPIDVFPRFSAQVRHLTASRL